MRTLTFAIVALFLGTSAETTVLLPADLGDLSREAYAIVRGRIAAVDARWTSAERLAIETIVTLDAERWLKGALGRTIQFRIPGGRLGRYRNIVMGAPEFAPGQQVILFLGARPPSLPYVLGLSQGVFRLAASGGEWVVTPPAILPATGPPVKIVRGDPARRLMPIVEFENHVRSLAEGRK
jgi:hypothetical protein